MTEKEALMRVKTGNFSGNYGFDMQLLVDAVGTLGEMFRNGQIIKVIRCKDCRHFPSSVPVNGVPFCKHIKKFVDADWFCADGKKKKDVVLEYGDQDTLQSGMMPAT